MGYTHYWDNGSFSDEQWNEALAVTKSIIRNASVPVQFEWDDDSPPVLDADIIRFNGVDEDGHETFVIHKDGSGSWDFCKTARKPYDEVVVATLTALSEINPRFTWSSDGDKADHKVGIELYQRAASGLIF